MAKPSLAIAIPAYCRAKILEDNLAAALETLRAHDVAIYVSDDSPDNETKEVVSQFASEYKRITYRQNVPSLGHDHNVLATLTWPSEDYVWLIGDGGMATGQGLEAFFASAKGQDFLFVNSHAVRPPSSTTVSGASAKEMIRDLLWHQTLTGATIFHRRVIEWALRPGAITLKRNFPQLSVILGYASSYPVTATWIAETGVSFSQAKKSYWADSLFPIFVDDFHAVITGYPSVIGPQHYRRVMRSHSQETGLLGAANLAWLRANGRFSRAHLRSHPHFLDASSANALTIRVIASTPRPLLRLLHRWNKRFRRQP